MTATQAVSKRPWPVSLAGAATVLVWAASVSYLAFTDRSTCQFALIVAGYALYLTAVGRWLLPRTVPLESEPVLRAEGTRPRLATRCFVVILFIALVALDGAAYAGIQSGVEVPLLTPMIRYLLTVHLWPGVGGVELLNFATYALVPGLLLLALGARPHELGLRLPARATAVATIVCLLPCLGYVGWGLARGKLTPLGVLLLVVHNLLSNGLSEEFQVRGMVFSHLRAFLRTDWALFIQAVVFALLHFHPNGSEELADPVGSLAGDIALNMPVALAFGYLALRSRSLTLPTLLHLFNWQP